MSNSPQNQSSEAMPSVTTTDSTFKDVPSSSIEHGSSESSDTQYTSFGSSPRHQSGKHHRSKNYQFQNPPPPTNCIVLKNLDYKISLEDLEEVVRRVTSDRNEFQSITPVEDKNTGSFRGMAFVNFHSVADATAALKELSKMVINGRKVITEYRRLRPNERKELEKRGKKGEFDKRAAFFQDRRMDDHRFEDRSERDREREAEFRALLVNYRKGDFDMDADEKDLVFDCTLTSYERRMVHLICGELELGHISRFDENGNRVLHVTKDPKRTSEWEKEAEEERAQQQQAQTLPKRIQRKKKDKENLDSDWKHGNVTKEELVGINYFKPKCAQTETGSNGEKLGIRAPSYKTFVPQRQPKGPDGTTGFGSRKKYAEGQQKQENGDTMEQHTYEVTAATEDLSLNENTEEKTVSEEDDSKKVATMKKNEKGAHKVLNPSVPAFSPSATPTY